MDPVLERILEKLQEQRYTCKDLEIHLNIANGGTTNWKNGGKSYYRHIGKIASFLKTTPTYLLTGNIENVGDLTEEEKDFIMTFREIDMRGKQCVMDIVKDFYSLNKAAQSVRSGATSKTDSMLKIDG